MQFALESTSESSPARIKVVGVGGAGGNAVNRMIEAGLRGVEFISINTDLQVLERNLAEVKIQIGSATTRGLGAGANPDRGRQSIEESQEIVAERLKGADMVFIAAGMGGGTGTGAAPVVAEIARELGILTVAVVTRPFDWEGMVRKRNARDGLAALSACVDTMIVIPNQKLLSVASKTMTMREAFRTADEVLHNAARGISEMILRPGEMNVDFADVSAIMRESGQALMGSGSAKGEGRARMAAEQALHCPLLDSVDIRGARGMLVNFTGGQILAHEVGEVMEYFRAAIGEEGQENIIFGYSEDDSSDEFRVTLIATGFDPEMQNLPQTNGVPTYAQPQAPQQTWRAAPPAQPAYQAPAPAMQPTYQPPAPAAPSATAGWNTWQPQAPAEGARAGTGSIAARGGAQRPSGQMPVAPQAPATGRTPRREPSGSQVAVAPLSNRPRGIFVPDLEDDMDDNIETPAYLRQRG
ncbi:MAG TPA: cell division protein FtsZ [Fibrobacteria bacterium]|nr:cell division protein FtsZ [Fibrobacteria bacterium]